MDIKHSHRSMAATKDKSFSRPAACLLTARSVRVTVGAVDLPAFLRRQDAAEGAALSESPAAFRVVQQQRADLLPGTLQDLQPLTEDGQGALGKPSLAGGFRPRQAGATRIAVDLVGDGSGQGQAAFIDLLVRLHGANRASDRRFRHGIQIQIRRRRRRCAIHAPPR